MNGISPTDELLNKAFQLAYFILADRTPAIYVAMAALDKLKTASTIQDRRLYYLPTGRSAYPASRTKVNLSDIHLLQRLIYAEAEPFERLIEGQGRSRQQEMIVYFVKHLVRMTTKHNSFYVVMGLCRLLYNYSTNETAEIYNLLIQDPDRGRDDYYYRSRKKHLLTELKARFGNALKTVRGYRGEERFQPQDNSEQYQGLIRECLTRFTPWESACVLPANVDPRKMTVASLWFKGKNPDEEHEIELNRIHTLVHPDCFERLVLTLGLDAPSRRLEIPYFYNSSDAGGATGDRLEPQGLSDGELESIRGFLDKNAARRNDATKALLVVFIDGNEPTSFEVGQRSSVQIPVAEDADLIEVRSIEADEEVSIAIHPIARNKEGIARAKATIKLGAGRMLSVSVQPRDDASNGTAGALVTLNYYDTAVAVQVWSGLRQFLRWTSNLMRAQPGAAVNYARIALASLLLAICLMGLLTFLRSRRSSPATFPRAEERAGKQAADDRQASVPVPGKSPAQPEVKPTPQALQTTPTSKQLAAQQTQSAEPGSTPNAGSTEESETTRGRQTSLPAATLRDVKRVYVDALGADALGRKIRELLVSNLQSSGRFVLVENRADADAVFKGGLKRVNHATGEVSASLRLVNARGQVIWSSGPANTGKESEIANKLINNLLVEIKKLEGKP